jgi:hypothetical protein
MAFSKLSPRGRVLAIVLGSSWFDQLQLLQGVSEGLPSDAAIVGQSTAGELVPSGPMSHSCAVLLLTSELFSWGIGLGEHLDRDPRQAGQQAAYFASRELRNPARKAFLFFSDGLAEGFTDATRGMQEALGTGAVIVGGLAGDDLRFSQTYQYLHHRVMTRSVVGVLLGGPGSIGIGIAHGFAPISKPRHITRAEKNILFELDGRPAATVYEEYFGARLRSGAERSGLVREQIAYPLGIRSETDQRWWLRNVTAFREDGSLVCSSDIPQGRWLQLMIGGRELALDAARQAAQTALQAVNRPMAALVFDSVARRMLFGPRYAAMELERLRQAIGPAVPLIGCYTYGEQAPLHTNEIAPPTMQTGAIVVMVLGG